MSCGLAAFDGLAVDGAVQEHDVVLLAVGFDLLQANQQVIPVLGEPHDGDAFALCRVAHALDLDRIDLAGLGVDFFRTQDAEVVGVDFAIIDDLIAHAFLAGGHIVLQGELVGGFVDHAAIERDLDRIATIGAGDHLGVPVEVQVGLLGFAQAAALEVIGLRQQGVLVECQGTFFSQAGDHHRSLEAQLPGAVAFLFQAAFGGTAHRQLFPVGGIAGGEGLKVCSLREGQGEQSTSEEQGATHKIS
ncbi:hypothetical protein EMIT0162MI3_20313 [Pseudomonas chlororaphis]